MRLQLSDNDRKYWAPAPNVVSHVESLIQDGGDVLEIGPGYVPFSKAQTFVDFDAKRLNTYVVDTAIDLLPFPDKSFDFIYCRHVLEDMYNPFLLIKEMSRVGKAGYVETPSPIVEVGRGVDGGSPPYRGYFHHRFIIWNVDGALGLVSKFPLIEYLQFEEEQVLALLKQGPRYWNTYLLWKDQIQFKHHQAPMDYDIMRDYGQLLRTAMEQSRASTDSFWPEPVSEQIPTIQRAFA